MSEEQQSIDKFSTEAKVGWMLECLDNLGFEKTKTALLEEFKGYNDSKIPSERQRLLSLNADKHIKKCTKEIKGVHSASVLAVRYSPHKELLASASGDRTLAIYDLEKDEVKHKYSLGRAGAISLDYHPTDENILLAGLMDHSHYLLDVSKPDIKDAVIQQWKDHGKYVIAIKWSPDGNFFATASYDHSVRLYQRDPENEGKYKFIKNYSFVGNVESLAFTKDSKTLIAAVRGDCVLHYINLETLEDTYVNMNQNGDDFISFTAMDIKLSSDDKYLLVATDKHRLIMFRTASSYQVRNFYGMKNDVWSTPKCEWSENGGSVYTTAEDHRVHIFGVGNEKEITSLKGHTNTIRDMYRKPGTDNLATASFDGTVRLWSA